MKIPAALGVVVLVLLVLAWWYYRPTFEWAF